MTDLRKRIEPDKGGSDSFAAYLAREKKEDPTLEGRLEEIKKRMLIMQRLWQAAEKNDIDAWDDADTDLEAFIKEAEIRGATSFAAHLKREDLDLPHFKDDEGLCFCAHLDIVVNQELDRLKDKT